MLRITSDELYNQLPNGSFTIHGMIDQIRKYSEQRFYVPKYDLWEVLNMWVCLIREKRVDCDKRHEGWKV